MLLGMSLGGWACSGPAATSSEVIVDRVNLALSQFDCSSAYLSVYPVYESSQSDNDIRLAMASTYGCYAGVNILGIVRSLTEYGGVLSGGGLWAFLVQTFPSVAVPDDKKPQSAEYGLDAVMAAISPGVFPTEASLYRKDTYNPGSLSYHDRISTANAFQTFLGMALIGSLLSRYGLPDANYHQTVLLPWTTAAATAGDGCALASGILHFSDGLEFLSSISGVALSGFYGTIQSFLDTVVDAACKAGCNSCGGSVSCETCPLSLRDRSSCTGSSTDVNSCAAAGIARMVNLTWQGP